MRIPRIYQSMTLSQGQEIQLDSQATVHVAKVLRLRQGDPIIVFNGQGGEYHGIIVRLEKRTAFIQLQSFCEPTLESSLDIVLAQGVSRGERMDYTIQKSVELGVRRIVPVITERTVVNLNAERQDKRVHHWQTVVHSACEQSGRNFVPPVDEVISLPHWLQAFSTHTPGQGNKFVLNHRADHGVQALRVDRQQPIYILIGPEGGLAEHEVARAEVAGFMSVRLGPRILRTETAALAFVSVLQANWGDYA
jgi:16S rRNA (uracil1498-N3)-methyltransferase